MDQDVASAVTTDHRLLGWKSWVAYAATTVRHALLLVIVALIGSLAPTLGWIALSLLVAHLVYRISDLRSFKLFENKDGVWVSAGILPWTSGVSGVKWRDLDEAVFFNTMFSWLTKSYTIRIGHRFTKSSEINARHIARGVNAVEKINAIHQDMVRGGVIERPG